jgi:hypothetical protein
MSYMCAIHTFSAILCAMALEPNQQGKKLCSGCADGAGPLAHGVFPVVQSLRARRNALNGRHRNGLSTMAYLHCGITRCVTQQPGAIDALFC